jgi:hypothetical protein
VVTNIYPHIWCYQLSFVEGSPFRDLRVRKAANLATDREGIVRLLNGMAAPAKGMVNPGHPWFGAPAFDIAHDPDQARRLLAEAGFGPRNPVRIRLIIAPSGSGQMQPLPMNELIQQNLRAVGIETEFDVMDWEALRQRRRLDAEAPENRGAHGITNSWAFWAGAVHRPPARRIQLGRLPRPARGRAGAAGAPHLRAGGAGARAGGAARPPGGAGDVALGGARREPARPRAAGARLHPGASLVPGPDADQPGGIGRHPPLSR